MSQNISVATWTRFLMTPPPECIAAIATSRAFPARSEKRVPVRKGPRSCDFVLRAASWYDYFESASKLARTRKPDINNISTIKFT